MIGYEDGPAAMDWLAHAFAFRETARVVGSEGVLAHGEMETGHGSVMMATPSRHYQSPRHHRESCPAAARWSEVPYIVDGVLVRVDDVDRHCERARAAGATILTEPETSPVGRSYRAEDIEGHRWMFVSEAPP